MYSIGIGKLPLRQQRKYRSVWPATGRVNIIQAVAYLGFFNWGGGVNGGGGMYLSGDHWLQTPH